MKKLEQRFVAKEIRAVKDGDKLVLDGYAAVFNSRSEDLGGFTEIVMPGAFAKTLKEKPDIRALWNHNADFILGRTKAKTLELNEDKTGLHMRVVLSDTEQGKYFYDAVDRGDIDGMSFGFRTVKDAWIKGTDGKMPTRELHEVELFEVSPVAFPAYPDTGGKLSVRDYLASIDEPEERITAVVESISQAEEPVHADHSEGGGEDETLLYTLITREVIPGGEQDGPAETERKTP